MRILLLAALTAFCYAPDAFAQSKGTNGKMLTDTFNGKIPAHNGYYTSLILRHCQYCDDGTFTLQETQKETKPGGKAAETKGEWTVLKGDAKDENATVVEIDAKKDTLYFLRLKNGDLQKLDAQLKEIKPTANYMLRKSK